MSTGAVIAFLFYLVTLAPSRLAAEPTYDGVVRPTGDGRQEAYMIPPYKSNHASFLELLPHGELLMAWFSGTAEGANNCSIVLARLPAGSQQWSKANLTARREGFSNQNPVLYYDNTSAVLYLYHSQQIADKKTTDHPQMGGREDNARVWMKESNDGQGLNWTDDKEIFTKPGSFDRNRIITSLSGDWLFPMYFAKGSGEEQFSAIQISSDHKTWKETDIDHSNNLVQPSVIRPKRMEKELHVYFRDRRAENIYTATSTDDGEHWTTPIKTKLVNNNSGIQANVLYHTTGNIVIVFNPTHHVRNPLVIAMSEDGGKTWPHQRVLQEDKTGKSVEFSYPTVLQSPDGLIHVSHTYNRETIKYQSFKEDWIKQKSDDSLLN